MRITMCLFSLSLYVALEVVNGKCQLDDRPFGRSFEIPRLTLLRCGGPIYYVEGKDDWPLVEWRLLNKSEHKEDTDKYD